MTSKWKAILRNLCKFIRYINKIVCFSWLIPSVNLLYLNIVQIVQSVHFFVISLYVCDMHFQL